jgi:hypothetical protein
MNHVEKFRILADIGNGLLCRIYNLKKKINSAIESKDNNNNDDDDDDDDDDSANDGGNITEMSSINHEIDGEDEGVNIKFTTYLTSDLFTKLFAKFDKRTDKLYPSIDMYKDLEIYSGCDIFIASSPDVENSLRKVMELYKDIIDFSNHSIEILINYPLKEVVEFRMDNNRLLSIIYFNLLVVYIKVMKLFSSISQNKTLFSIYNASTHYSNGVISVLSGIYLSFYLIIFNLINNIYLLINKYLIIMYIKLIF